MDGSTRVPRPGRLLQRESERPRGPGPAARRCCSVAARAESRRLLLSCSARSKRGRSPGRPRDDPDFVDTEASRRSHEVRDFSTIESGATSTRATYVDAIAGKIAASIPVGTLSLSARATEGSDRRYRHARGRRRAGRGGGLRRCRFGLFESCRAGLWCWSGTARSTQPSEPQRPPPATCRFRPKLRSPLSIPTAGKSSSPRIVRGPQPAPASTP